MSSPNPKIKRENMKTFEGQMTNFGKLRANMYVLQLRGCFVDVVPNKRRLGGLSFMGPS